MSERPQTLTWLHIGDFHVKDGDPYDRDTVLKALVEAVRYQKEKLGRHLDFIFVTGDEANSGTDSQYERVTKFLTDLEDAAGVGRDRVFVLPGNHDVDRNKGRRLDRTLSTVQASHEFFGSPDDVRLYLRKQEAFRKWHDDYFKEIRKLADATTCEPPVVVDVNGLKVAVAQINSALFCQDEHDYGKLWIGRRCLEPVVEQVGESGANIRIALIHHPLDWLHEGERSNITALIRDNFDVILRGHLHENDAEAVAGVTGSALHLSCGAAYQGSDWPNRVMYVTVDYEAKKLTIIPIRYEDSPRPIWTTDPSVWPREQSHEGVLDMKWKSAVEEDSPSDPT